MDWIRDPQDIYARSFATVRAEADLSAIPPDARPLAVRMIHACGMVDLASDIRISEGFVDAARRSTLFFADCEMVRHGVIPRFLPPSGELICTLNDPRARERGLAERTTRSAAAVGLWQERLGGSVCVIGNAPTALFALLELIDGGAPRPAAIIGCPVGFVGAVESKEELVRDPRGIPYVTVRGRRGGSAIAAAALNAVFAP